MPAITNGNARRVLYYPDGEAIDRTDDNNAQLFQQQRDWIALFSAMLTNGAGDPNDPGGLDTPESSVLLHELSIYGGSVISLHPGSAFVAAGGANALTINAGTIAAVVDEPWSTGEDLGMFRIPGALTLATAVGHATQPRIDVVEIKLAYIDGDPQTRHFEDATTRAPSSQVGTDKERQLEFTYQIKQGTPAASPAYPACSVGFVPMAAVYVPALHNAVHDPANIRDLRMPVGIRAIDVLPNEMYFTGANPWVNLGLLAAAAGASDADADRVIVPCPVSTKSARLIAVGVQGQADGGDTRCDLVRMVYADGTSAVTFTKLAELIPIFEQDGLAVADSMMIADAIAAHAEILGTRTERAGTALWCNGQPGGMAHPGLPYNGAAGEKDVTKLAISIGDVAGGRLGFVRFWIAEGL